MIGMQDLRAKTYTRNSDEAERWLDGIVSGGTCDIRAAHRDQTPSHSHRRGIATNLDRAGR